MKLDVLVFAAHPDDAELSCAGTILSLRAQGKKVGLIDLTLGQMGTRGTIQTRTEEAAEAAKILGVEVRENLGFQDIFFTNDNEHKLKIIEKIRQYQPEIVLANAIADRHPDHPKAARLLEDAVFWSGLSKIETFDRQGNAQKAYRPRRLFHYVQADFIRPDFVIDITPYWEKKKQAIAAFKTQFYDPNSQEPETFISKPAFLHALEARAREYGHMIGVEFAEGFTSHRFLGVKSLFDLI